MSTILVVDDKEMMRDSVATTLARKGHTVVSANHAQAALQKIAERSFDAVITDLQMPEMNGVELLAEIRKLDEQLPVILMTAYGSVETAVSAMKQGAYDYLTKPFSGDVLLVTIERALERSQLVKENNILRATASAGSGRSTLPRSHQLVGNSQMMAQLRERLARIADSHGTVLISGESGAGKEVAARWIHEHSPRASMPFLAINCAALSRSLLESELFGHEKGAFTGADKLRKGRFELAEGGTLLLDEISEIPPDLQAKLLRVLQERSFERVGSSASRCADVRIIATSNRDLAAEVNKGSFRQDLYFRLNVLPLCMPPLRNHLDDVPELAACFLTEVAAREGRPQKSLEEQAVQVLQQYHWPGNVRELQNICERAAVLTTTQTISASLIGPWLCSTALPPEQPMQRTTSLPTAMIEVQNIGGPPAINLHSIVCDGKLTLEEIEREVIVATIEHNQGHRQRSASALGIGVRTLGLKLKKWKEQQLVDASL